MNNCLKNTMVNFVEIVADVKNVVLIVEVMKVQKEKNMYFTANIYD